MVRKSYGGLRGLLEGNLLMHLQGPGRGRRTPADGDAARKAAHFGGLVHSCIEANFHFCKSKLNLHFFSGLQELRKFAAVRNQRVPIM